MISQFFKLSLALVLGLLGWILYERAQWDQDYTRYSAPVLPSSPIDTTFLQHINTKLFQNATVISNNTHLLCPEDIAVSDDGIIYTGLIDGSIVSVRPGWNETTLLFKHNDTGRIYGIILAHNDSTLYYLSALRGLIKLDLKTLQPVYLLQKIGSRKLRAVNNLCIDEDNQILYITESTPIRMTFAMKQALLKHSLGIVFSFNLKTHQAIILLQNLAFPNGIVYEKNSHSLIFSELNRATIWKYDLTSGKKVALVQNLFGYADNLKLSDQGQVLVAIPGARAPHLQFLNEYPGLRKLLMYLPESLLYAIVVKRAGGIKIDPATGKITEYIFGAPVKSAVISTLLEKNGKTYFSSLRSPTILVVDNSKKQIQAADTAKAESNDL